MHLGIMNDRFIYNESNGNHNWGSSDCKGSNMQWW